MIVAINAISVTSPNHIIANWYPRYVAISVVIGTPMIIPALTPIITLLIALFVSSFGTISPATVKDNPQYTGWNIAGIILHINAMLKSVMNALMKLKIVNIDNTSMNDFFRSYLLNSNGMNMAHIAIVNANRLTNRPACVMFTLKYSVIWGRIPTTPISVLSIPKVPNIII